MTLEEKGDLQRLRFFRRAEERGNVSQACREAGLARSFYDQFRGPFLAYGPIGLHPKHRRGRPGRPPTLDAQPRRLDRATDLSDCGFARLLLLVRHLPWGHGSRNVSLSLEPLSVRVLLTGYTLCGQA